ncbi:Putative ciliary rootlet coiled-coil protein 2 [Pleodorina starrii]|uniref:Ciliary rootlet coiled-coil protein 2 n=1 Tax=Pleodorina starrii TaxID=330485 RepID=A0A9W6BL48_9CHLO|nr:Putative ciliary rootlet coiled-coil protein 2 [Pleodorina starrii]GLC72960.1 Putative ciliary rootlet coiled-coil protein 2 [Pleodorina starrii]
MAFIKAPTFTLQHRRPRPLPLDSHLPARRRVQPLRNSNRNDAAAASSPSSTPSSTTSSKRIVTAAASHASATPAVAPLPSGLSGGALLSELQTRARSPGTVNVYGKPYTKTELAALDAAAKHLAGDARGSAAAAGGPAALRRHLTEELLLDAAVSKRTPLPLVEGAMALVELLPPPDAEAEAEADAGSASGGVGGDEHVPDSPALLPRYRWQLVVGADVGGVQYIPAVEELEVSPDGSSFTLGTDLDFIFTGFSGPCEWLAPGHLSYSVRQVRVELRWPKAWRRAAAWLAWRRRLGGAAATAAAAAGDEPEWGDSLPTSQTCRDDPTAPAANIPLTFFPTNEILYLTGP